MTENTFTDSERKNRLSPLFDIIDNSHENSKNSIILAVMESLSFRLCFDDDV